MSKRKKQKNQGLGRTLIKSRNAGHRNIDGDLVMIHTTDDEPSRESILDQTDLSSLMEHATLSGRSFEAEKMQTIVLTQDAFVKSQAVNSSIELEDLEKEWNHLSIPRRPDWDKTTTKEELLERESRAFLEWRRELARLEEEEHLLLTPFEKNIEVWRQLWRVSERSDVVVQIVDARHPLLFRSIDLETMISELDGVKKNLLLVNKADYLTEEQREYWASYFTKEGIQFIFFSAKDEQERQEREGKETDVNEVVEMKKQEEDDSEEVEENDSKEEEDDCDVEEEMNSMKVSRESIVAEHDGNDESPRMEVEVEKLPGSAISSEAATSDILSYTHVYSADDLLDRLVWECTNLSSVFDPKLSKVVSDYDCKDDKKFTVGMVGYPNVGKSSTINSLMGSKRVAVSHTPGKTKHFQTLVLPNSPLVLCDCPGLVFPSVASTKAEMVVNGLIRIAELRDHISPTAVICRRIPRRLLEGVYGFILPAPRSHEDPNRLPTPEEVLCAFGFMKGFMTGHGLPDQHRSARVILKDFVTGKLLYCHPPPGVKAEDFSPLARLEALMMNKPEPSIYKREGKPPRKIKGLKTRMPEGVADEELLMEMGQNSGLIDVSGGDLSRRDPNDYRTTARGRKVRRREKKKAKLANMTGAYTTGKRGGNYSGGSSGKGLPTSIALKSNHTFQIGRKSLGQEPYEGKGKRKIKSNHS